MFVRSTGNGISHQFSTIEDRKRALQRKEAGDAYRKQAEYYRPKLPTLSELEELLLGNKERVPEKPEVSAAIRELQQLESDSIKGPSTPIQQIAGHTLEKTIELLEKERSHALESPNPTQKDMLVATSASAEIQQVKTQISLNEVAERQVEQEVNRQKADEAEVFNRSSQLDFQTPKVLEEDLEKLQKKRLMDQAIAKYSYQVHLKRFGFVDQQPSFFRIA